MASTLNTPTIPRSATWIGGIALLLVAVLAGIGNFGSLTPLITAGDAATTAQAIAGAEQQFRVGVLLMLAAAALDIVVAAALLIVLKPVNRSIAVTAAWFRVAYSAVFVVAIAQLGTVPNLLDQPEIAMNAIDAYLMIWRTGLVLFAVHLVLVGYLVFRSRIMPRWLGVLVAIAGLGYLIDGVGVILIADYTPTVSTFTFIGEVVLIVWLIVMAVQAGCARAVVLR